VTSPAERFLLRLVRLFPSGFRHEFGPDMEEQIRTDVRRARAAGFAAGASFTVLTAVDLLRAACAERWNPTWVGARADAITTQGREGIMGEWMRDLGFAARSLRHAPGFAVMAIGTLGVAIGANAAIFAVVDAVLLDPLPFESPDRLVVVEASAPGSDFPEKFGISSEFYLEYRKAQDVFEEASTFNSFTSSLRVGDRVERVPMSNPTPTLFATLGVTPEVGRLPDESDDDRVALISHALWVDWFGADPDVIGQTHSVSNEPRTIIGVMGPEFRFPADRVQVWFPDIIRAEDVAIGRFGNRIIGRLKPDVDLDVARDRLTAIARQLPEIYGGTANYARLLEQHRAVVTPLEEDLLGDVSGPLWVLLASVGIVLLIASANVANLFLVRGEQRQRDIALRHAIGAGRGQIVRAYFAEAILVAGGAGILAVAISWVGVPTLVNAAPDGLPGAAAIAISPMTLFFTFLVSVAAAVACGLPVALGASRPNPAALRDGARGSTRGRRWGRDALVVAQTALGLVLLVGSGLLVRSFNELRRVDPGYDIENLMTFQLGVESEEGLTDGPTFARFHMDFADRLRALPGVESVGIIENVPLNEGVGSTGFVTRETESDPDGGVLLGRTWAGADYFATMGITVDRGRVFEDSDHTSNPGNVVISRTAAERLFPDQDPIGKQLSWPQLGSWETVIGVVDDVMQYSLRDEVQPMVYFPLVAQSPEAWALTSPAYVVRTGRADQIAPEIRALAQEAAPLSPMYRVFTLEELTADSMVQLSFTMFTLAVAAALALVLGIVGLYGVLSYIVAERTREIGVRMALGAQADRVRRMVVLQGVRVVLIGVLLGAAVAAGAANALDSLLFGVESIDPATFVLMSVVTVLTGAIASYVPARRASRVDPVESLRGG